MYRFQVYLGLSSHSCQCATTAELRVVLEMLRLQLRLRLNNTHF